MIKIKVFEDNFDFATYLIRSLEWLITFDYLWLLGSVLVISENMKITYNDLKKLKLNSRENSVRKISISKLHDY